jgi:hypothetical protein
LDTAISLVVLSFHGIGENGENGENGDIARVGHVVFLLYPDNEKCPNSDSHANASLLAEPFKISKY